MSTYVEQIQAMLKQASDSSVPNRKFFRHVHHYSFYCVYKMEDADIKDCDTGSFHVNYILVIQSFPCIPTPFFIQSRNED